MNISVGGVIEIPTAITKDCQQLWLCACSSKGHRKSGVISIKHSRDTLRLVFLAGSNFSEFSGRGPNR